MATRERRRREGGAAGAGTPAAVRVARVAGCCALYVATALVGLRLTFDGSIVTLFWLPTGVAVAALTLWGAPMVAPLAVTIALLQAWLGAPWWAAAGMGAGGVLGPWIASRILVRRGLDPGFGDARDFRSLGLAAAVGMLVTATVGNAMLAAAGRVPVADAIRGWAGWYAGDALGVVLAAPLLLALHQVIGAGRGEADAARLPRAGPAALLTVVGLLALGATLTASTDAPQQPQGIASMFVLQLAVAAGAAWFAVLGAWTTLLGVCIAVALPAAAGVGPFVRAQVDEGHWLAWGFLLLGVLLAVLTLDARRRLEAVQHALGMRERQLRAMFEQANAGLAVSAAGRFVLVNEAFATMLGRHPDQIVGRRADAFSHPEDLRLVADALRRGAGGRASAMPFEQRFVHGDGRIVWARVAISVVDAGDGAAPQVVSVAMDISALKRIEASLRRRSEQLALVFDATGSGIYDHDLETGRAYYSDSYLRMLGHPAGTVLRPLRDELERLHPDDRARFIAGDAALLERRVPFDQEYRLRRADGGWAWVHARGSATWDASGRAVRSFGAIADISGRKAAESALLDSRARLSAIIDSALDAVVAVDDRGRVVLFNPAAEALFGRPAADVLGRSMLPLVPARRRGDALGRLMAFAASARGGGGPAAGRTTMSVLHGDGTEFLADASVTMVSVDAGRLVTLMLRDARERERIESAEAARARAEAANRAKSDFLSRMSHELRTPLNAVLGFAQLLEIDGEPPLATVQRERVRAIREAGAHLGALIDELLDLTSIESDRMRLTLADVEVRELLVQSLRLVSSIAQERGVRLVPLDETVAAAPRVVADATRLRQVLVNLLSNAIKYNRAGGSVRVRAADAGDGTAWIEVEDDGPGIPAEARARLFQPFERLGRERGDVEGTGIGLALSRRLVELMGGRIEVDSEPGNGATFRLRLASAPRAALAAPAAGARDRPASAAAPAIPGRA